MPSSGSTTSTRAGTDCFGPQIICGDRCSSRGAAGRTGRWRQWDWATAAPSSWHIVEPGQRLIVEGIGALTPATRALADLGIWVDADDAERKRRALERDGDTYRPHWDRWAAQEDEFINRFQPRACADLIAVPTARGFEFTASS